MSRKEKMFKGNGARPLRDVIEERELKGAFLKNYGNSNRVAIEWDLNPSAIADQIFKLKIGDKEAYIDAEEFRRFLRWI